MNDRLNQLQRMLASARGRRLLAGRSFVIALVLALLLIPSTCAHMAGPHSIFTDPTGGGHAHHQTDHASHTGIQSVEELAWLVVNGDGSPGWMMSQVNADDDCPTRPRLRDLPSTMTMSAVNAPLTIDCERTLDLPTADEPAIAGAPLVHAVSLAVEPPPPR